MTVLCLDFFLEGIDCVAEEEGNFLPLVHRISSKKTDLVGHGQRYGGRHHDAVRIQQQVGQQL